MQNRTMIVLILCAASTWCIAQPAHDAEMATVHAALRQRLLTLRSQPEGLACRQRVEQARKARANAETALPGIQAVDSKIEEIRSQLKNLKNQRHAIVRAHAGQLAKLEDEITSAEEALTGYERNDPQIKDLLAQRKALRKEIEDGPGIE